MASRSARWPAPDPLPLICSRSRAACRAPLLAGQVGRGRRQVRRRGGGGGTLPCACSAPADTSSLSDRAEPLHHIFCAGGRCLTWASRGATSTTGTGQRRTRCRGAASGWRVSCMPVLRTLAHWEGRTAQLPPSLLANPHPPHLTRPRAAGRRRPGAGQRAERAGQRAEAAGGRGGGEQPQEQGEAGGGRAGLERERGREGRGHGQAWGLRRWQGACLLWPTMHTPRTCSPSSDHRRL